MAATEGIVQLATGKLYNLSEQELVDCDKGGFDEGCAGGYMESAFEFIVKNQGIANQTQYPYTGSDGNCTEEKTKPPAATITGYEIVPERDEEALLKAVANQPVSISIDGGGFDFQFYHTGVFTGDCGIELNHGVAAVGYNVSEDGIKYWIVKNSWGTGWGEEGFMRIQRDVLAKEGLCGLALDSSYPIY